MVFCVLSVAIIGLDAGRNGASMAVHCRYDFGGIPIFSPEWVVIVSLPSMGDLVVFT